MGKERYNSNSNNNNNDNKHEILRDGKRVLYHLPEKDAYGLANYSEKSRIKYEEDVKRMNRSLKRFRRIAARNNSKKAVPAGPPPG